MQLVVLLVSNGLPIPSGGAGVWLCGNQSDSQLQGAAAFTSVEPGLLLHEIINVASKPANKILSRLEKFVFFIFSVLDNNDRANDVSPAPGPSVDAPAARSQV